mmetsp:Transcript_6353/g.8947  ORF Transcript_6353/g.8947 Transcript_6353/m.8947 type:complete len:90 (+) Transcript_6353:61-330(+)|eukprot:CAMPEP_0197285256 /NCGR_PEP_ID=MMETSP0890-20130614/477_1 /TAXON_ID=44058 ORGANISM="Aureoumbra lagunensis, Strain CCMP1510" /NCGR_SAMPLE_ID=MMETSP0890 /ASSEMBLY_ACC=CAM_ASM_000533 /LENGTH=89 /DNA_ID=CAMNT_0042752569 /DNA_START=59 /DNA_END=328 /DNA_ORIENTATION=-
MATSILNALKPLLNPALYKKTFMEGFDYVSKNYMLKDKMAEPVVGFMLTIGTVGYFIEYFCLGRYHVAHKKEKIAKALEEYDARHGNHH